MSQAQNFLLHYVETLETSHDFNKSLFKAYTRAKEILILAAGGFILVFADNSKIKADSYGFNLF